MNRQSRVRSSTKKFDKTVDVEITNRRESNIWFHADPPSTIKRVKVDEVGRKVTVWFDVPVTNVIINGVMGEPKPKFKNLKLMRSL